MRTLALVLLLASTIVRADPPKPVKPPKVVRIYFEIWHERDGAKRPNQVKERYELGADNVLHYSAYFGGMPIEMNHNDDVTWRAGDAGTHVLAAAAKAAGDLVVQPDDKPLPNAGMAIYIVGFSSDAGDATRIAADPKGKAWRAIDPAFVAMIARFEQATGRPLKPAQLPQH